MLLKTSRRSIVVVGAVLAAILTASPSFAGDAASPTYLMTAGDLRAEYGPVRDSTSTDLGRVLPSSCDSPSTSIYPVGRESVSAPYREIVFDDGLSIQNTVYVYRSTSSARASFDQLQSRTLTACRGEVFSPFGDDQELVPQVLAAGSRRLPPGRPGFSVGQSVILLDPANAPPGYTDFYAYGVFTLVGNAIVQVQTYSEAPIPPVARADIRHVNRLVAARYARAAS